MFSVVKFSELFSSVHGLPNTEAFNGQKKFTVVAVREVALLGEWSANPFIIIR